VIDKLIRKLQARHLLEDREIRTLADCIQPRADAKSGDILVRRRDVVNHSTLLVEGLVVRYKDMANGTRQVTAIHVPGDFVDLHSFTLKRLDHSIMAVTPCTLAIAPHERLREVTEQEPRLARILWFSTMLDAAIHREWEVSLGRRTSEQRIAHLFCELLVRFDLVGMVEDGSYPLPMTQADISECLGLTPVHVNRILKPLRDAQLASFHKGRVTIFNRRDLEDLAEFDPTYLYLDRGQLPI
jgi:CRP-like cAMP-binding protein